MDATQTGSVFGPVEVASTYEETIDRLGTAIRIGMLAPGSSVLFQPLGRLSSA